MFVFPCYFRFLLFIFICHLIDNTFEKNSLIRYERQASSSRLKSTLEKLVVNNNNNRNSKAPSDNKYTSQDIAIIKSILSRKVDDYYGILGVSKHSTRTDIEGAYRKLALRVHTDKNSAPDAKEAMQRVNRARVELLKKLKSSNSNSSQQRTGPSKSQTDDRNDFFDESDLTVTTPSLSSNNTKRTSNFFENFPQSNYLIFGGIGFLCGILIIFICNRKQCSRQKPRNSDSSSFVDEE